MQVIIAREARDQRQQHRDYTILPGSVHASRHYQGNAHLLCSADIALKLHYFRTSLESASRRDKCLI
jgi:hypothetical protein